MPMMSNAGSRASIAKATTDIKEAIRATNSSCEEGCFGIVQKYSIRVSILFKKIIYGGFNLNPYFSHNKYDFTTLHLGKTAC